MARLEPPYNYSTKSWAALLKLIYEVDPLLCPNCRMQMKVISIIKDGVAIDKILDHLQYKFEVLLLAGRSPPRESSPCDSDHKSEVSCLVLPALQ